MVNFERGDVVWADFGDEPIGSQPAGRRPALVISADNYNATRINTVVLAVITSNTRLAKMPGNVFVPQGAGGLPKDSVVNVTQLFTLDKRILSPALGMLPQHLMDAVDTGLRRVMGL